jgi:hypothetical protein
MFSPLAKRRSGTPGLARRFLFFFDKWSNPRPTFLKYNTQANRAKFFKLKNKFIFLLLSKRILSLREQRNTVAPPRALAASPHARAAALSSSVLISRAAVCAAVSMSCWREERASRTSQARMGHEQGEDHAHDVLGMPQNLTSSSSGTLYRWSTWSGCFLGVRPSPP